MHEAKLLSPPEFAPMLLGISAVMFILGAAIMFKRPDPSGRADILDALVPFALPVGVLGLTILIITAIGSLLLVVANSVFIEVHGSKPVTLAVPVALVMAIIILGVCGLMARGGETSDGANSH
ncbi:MAG: hypothetical protein EXR51_00210 [Dehalococcoidia bacterium]|nr:hypothetical protein [Dehalococcoidia bacterium]